MLKESKTILFLCVFLFIGYFDCSKKETTEPEIVTPEDLLIKNDEISGWTATGNKWTASSSGELNNVINGEEPLYTRHGFVEAAMQSYSGTVLSNEVIIELRIFDQGKETNAKALLDEVVLQLVNHINWTPGVGDEAKIERFPLSQKILFRSSKYFVSISITSGLDEALDVLKTFASNVDSKI